jgi:hypothetical protein
MKKEDLKINDEDTMREEYDFDYSKAVWGKSARKLLKEGANIVVIQPDVFEVFPDSASVNDALRSLIELSKKAGAAKARRKKRPAAVASRAGKD